VTLVRCARHRPSGRVHTLLVALCTVASAGCGYGFGNHEFRRERTVAIAFARALEVRDTARLRQLSWGLVHDSIRAIVREIPAAYAQFSQPSPEPLTVHGGGIYGGDGEFLFPSARLASCRGGVQLLVIMEQDAPRIVTVHLVPPPDSVTDAACRAQINPS